VYLRFGNAEGTGKPIMSYYKIAVLVKKWPTTVHSALRRWERDGGKAIDLRANNGNHMKQRAVL
jgi:hypothetical protein